MPDVEHPKEFTQEEVAMWLVAIGMGDKIDVFKQNSIDGDLLVTLTTADLTGDLGFTNLQARKLLLHLEWITNLATAGGGGDNSAQTAEIASLKAQVAQLQKSNHELQAKLYGTAPAPAPQPAPAQAAAPPPKKQSGGTHSCTGSKRSIVEIAATKADARTDVLFALFVSLRS